MPDTVTERCSQTEPGLRSLAAVSRPTVQPGPRRKVGRPAKLTVDAILDAGERLGLTTFTVAQLAADLGVSEGALYRHVRSTGEIVHRACSRILGRVDTRLDELDDWTDYVEQVCRQVRELAVRFPGFGPWVVAGDYDEDALAVFDRILDGIIRREPTFTPDTAYLVGSQAVACTVGLVASGYIGAVPGEPTDSDLDDQFDWMLGSLLRGMSANLADEVPPPRSRALRARETEERS
jgi:AcrR family transcriptional regulator